MRSTLLAITVVVLVSCTTYSGAPSPKAVTTLPKFELLALRDHAVSITISDLRMEPADTERLKGEFLGDLGMAMTNAGVKVESTALDTIDLKIYTFRADFGDREWKGCALVGVRVKLEGQEPLSFDVDRCTTTSNMAGMRPDRAAINKTYRDVLTEVLARLNSL